MRRSSLHVSPDRDSADGRSKARVTQSLSCQDCTAADFPNLSKLNKHRNIHERPYACHAENCSERFAQRQALNRHIETQHSDATTRTRFYHCTVDGCKYSSSGRWRRKFTRADQVKEHIKDYGHYGPHSANDRPRRPPRGRNLSIHVITARFEEWDVRENGISQPTRMLRSYEYDSFKTRLWHMDVWADVFLTRDEEASDGYKCPVENCYYYESGPPEGCERVVFKALTGFQEHYRRAHERRLGPLHKTQLEGRERQSIAEGSLTSTDTFLDGIWSDDLESQYDLSAFCSFGMSTDQMKVLNEMEVQPPLSSGSANNRWEDDSYVSCQRGTTSTQQLESMAPQVQGASSEQHFPPLSSSTGSLDKYFPVSVSEPASKSDDYRVGPLTSNASSRSCHDLLKSRTTKPRIPCDFPSCTTTFCRKYEKQRHMETIHSLVTPHSCYLCDSKFRRQDKLMSHLQSKHFVDVNQRTKSKSMISDSLAFSCYGSMPGSESNWDVVPGDTLAKENPSSENWMEGIGAAFGSDDAASALRNVQPVDLLWQSENPMAMLMPDS